MTHAARPSFSTPNAPGTPSTLARTRHFSAAARLAFGACLLGVLAGCENKPSENAAPVSSSLEAAKAPASSSKRFVVDAPSSKATFLMDAPLEKIYGEANQAITGHVFLDPADITKSSALLRIDLLKLNIFQEKRADEAGQFGERAKDDTQNSHMRTWFEISDDVPPVIREKNRFIEFKLTKIAPSTASVAELKGDSRTFTATVTGDLRLHQRTVSRSTKLDITVRYAGEQPVSLRVKSLEPMLVGLEEHDVRPRSAFDKLTEKGLAALGSKVASSAPVSIEFEAKAP